MIEAGFEVIYTGLHQTIDGIVRAALQEDPDIIGLSILSGAHLPICNQLQTKLREAQLEDIPVVIGGVIPREDTLKLDDMGVKAIFTAGAKFDEIAADLYSLVKTDHNV